MLLKQIDTHKQNGIGLAGLFIGLLLSSLIITALLQQYIRVKQHSHYAQVQLEQRYAIEHITELLRASIRNAGFTPCLGIEHLITLDQRDGHTHLRALEVGASPRVQINRMGEDFNSVVTQLSATKLLIANTYPINPSYPVLIADCYHAEVLRIRQLTTTKTGQHITLMQPLAFSYHDPVYVGEWLQEVFFIQTGGPHAGRLFYKLQHTDQVSVPIHNMSVHLEPQTKPTLVQIIFTLEAGGRIRHDTLMRTP